MKENNELERKDIAVCDDIEVDCDIQNQITVYLETWFDVDKKFGINILDEEGTWLNLYAKYDPFADTLWIEYEIDREGGSEWHEYTPTEDESKLIKDMIAERIKALYNQTPQEFCEGFYADEITVGEIK